MWPDDDVPSKAPLDALYAELLREQPHNAFLRQRIRERQRMQTVEREPGEDDE